jgi:hypothetical protein
MMDTLLAFEYSPISYLKSDGQTQVVIETFDYHYQAKKVKLELDSKNILFLIISS